MPEYFPHDYDAQHDEKTEDLIKDMSWEGYGIYWAVVERIYMAGGYIKQDYEKLAYNLRADIEKVKKVIKNFKLFEIKGEKITSKTILKRLKHRKKISKERSMAAKKKHKIQQELSHTKAVQLQNNCHAIKEKKRKEKKIKRKEKKRDISNSPRVHERLLGFWGELYLGSQGYKYIANFGKDILLLKNELLSLYSEAQIKDMMRKYFETMEIPKYFHYEKTPSIGLFKAVANEMVTALKKEINNG